MTFREWFDINKKNLIFTLVVILSIIVIFVVIKFIFNRLKRGKSNKAISLLSLIYNICRFVSLAVAIFVIIAVWGMDPTIGLVILCTLIIVAGLGLHSLLNDVFVGMNTIFTNMYEVDDFVEINGFKGKVISISINKTQILASSGELKTISNGQVKEVVNYSKNPISASVYIPIENTRDTLDFIEKLEEKLRVLKDEYPQIVEGPIVNGIEDFKDGNVIIKISAKTKYELKHIIERALRKKVLEIGNKYNIKVGAEKLEIKENKYE